MKDIELFIETVAVFFCGVMIARGIWWLADLPWIW